MSTACVVLAAGLGKRMRSDVPKVLHPVCGITMIECVLSAAKRFRPEKIVVVAGKHIDVIRKSLGNNEVAFALQKEAKGTGHALLCARSELGDFRGTVLVLNGDTPLICHDTIRQLLRLHRKERNGLSVLSFEAANPQDYGRVVRDETGRVTSIVEDRDTDEQQKKMREVNSGVYAIDSRILYLLDRIRRNRAKGEYYLTDIVAEAYRGGVKAAAYCIGAEEDFLGVNTREELSRASMLMRKRLVKKWAGKGVSFLDADSVFIHAGVTIGRDAIIYPNVHLEGNTKIGRGTTVFPHVRIVGSEIGSGVVIKDSTLVEESKIRNGASVGPFAHVRPGCEVGPGAKIGNFVELKKAVIGRKSKASHLSYLGDATIGRGVNIGAGTITCNYDGDKKYSTVLGDGVFVGSDTQLVAPVKVGRGAYIGAGSTITKDVPAGALAISRTAQKNVEGWVKKRKSKVKG
ncbi:MAG: bifunctional UDP-N-acetylglucosamine diphosphorylase/glucosamine-1-phosphate N-acetyltransferase GlmU [Nitrospiraceae bacterium]|nr:bifunctional UDP-N-acetylglucosamine diphosphorylase/glucosamine-1-phosphate N-acetyltransferase GlmU [Nitrospiraceae bacterium]